MALYKSIPYVKPQQTAGIYSNWRSHYFGPSTGIFIMNFIWLLCIFGATKFAGAQGLIESR